MVVWLWLVLFLICYCRSLLFGWYDFSLRYFAVWVDCGGFICLLVILIGCCCVGFGGCLLCGLYNSVVYIFVVLWCGGLLFVLSYNLVCLKLFECLFVWFVWFIVVSVISFVWCVSFKCFGYLLCKLVLGNCAGLGVYG